MFKRLCLCIIFVGVVSSANAATYWVTTSGNDTNGCNASATPLTTTAKRTPAGAMTCLSAGDTLFLRTGVYAGLNTNVTTIPSGTSYTNAVTIAEYPGDSVTFTLAASTNAALNLASGSLKYVIFDGMSLDGTGGDYAIGTFSTVSYIKFINVEFNNSTNLACIQLGPSAHHFWITGGSIHHCGSYGIYAESADHLVEYVAIHTTGQNGSGNNYAIHNFTNYTPLNEPSRNTYRYLTVSGTGGILLWRGDSNVAYGNFIYNADRCFSVRGGATNTSVYNNSCYNPTAYAFELDGSTGTILTNNAHWGGATTSIVVGTGTVQSYNSCYISGCTGTGAINGANPNWLNPAIGDLRLPLGSPLINAGGDVGLGCNAGCSIGAVDPPELIGVDVGTAGANKITLTFDTDAAPPLRATTTFAAGWTGLKAGSNNPVVSATLIGNAVIELTMQNAYLATDGCSVSYAQASGSLTDSVAVGSTWFQPFLSRTTVPCVNNVSGSPAPVLTQVAWRVRELYGSESAAGWKAAENAQYDVIVSGAGRLRIKAKAEVLDPPAFNVGFHKRITLPGGSPSAKTILGNTCSPTDQVCFYGTGTVLGVSHNAATTEQLTSTLGNTGCFVLLTNSTPSIDPGINTEWECEIAFKFDPSLPKGSVVEIFMTRNGGAEFESYSQTATLRVIDNQFIDGG